MGRLLKAPTGSHWTGWYSDFGETGHSLSDHQQMMDAFLGSYSGKLEAVSGDLGVDVSEIAANNSSTLGLEAVAVKTRDLFSNYLNQLMVQDYTLAEENSLSFLDTIMEDKEDTFQITDPSQQSNEEVSQEEVMVNEETKEVDKMEEETQTNGEDNGTEIQAGQ
ncbi:hypothetical protein ISN44_As04g006970 [Arabidopsis suecica]|uniref:Uncharacterized protein n=1 Tax=Arabidopsis suecica TaxID=45249 RepID=A0A8T2E951_ARASU|nr:hypothetical protein ISN44_As04g006970 [Arabidopsis suecica]